MQGVCTFWLLVVRTRYVPLVARVLFWLILDFHFVALVGLLIGAGYLTVEWVAQLSQIGMGFWVALAACPDDFSIMLLV